MEKDLTNGFNHILLARGSTVERAESLYNEIYSEYADYNPVIVHSKLSNRERAAAFSKIDSGSTRIVVCVDMFGEGIDIPSLKIAAIHDKYKSLPVLLQFIGRFTRTGTENIGPAKFVANTAGTEPGIAVNQLFEEDAEWNSIVKNLSEFTISAEIRNQKFFADFKQDAGTKIDLSLVKLKISTRIFSIKNVIPDFRAWEQVLNDSAPYCV